jgi:putative transcription antitermination factor YqgF
LNHNAFELNRVRIGIDYGPRIIGLAISDPFGIIYPCKTIKNDGNLTDISMFVLKLAKENSASEVVIGIPLDSNGVIGYNTRNFNGRMCLNFSKVLSSYTRNEFSKIKIILCDERYTTKEAKIKLESNNYKGN